MKTNIYNFDVTRNNIKVRIILREKNEIIALQKVIEFLKNPETEYVYIGENVK